MFLFCLNEGDPAPLTPGVVLVDARGNAHTVASVSLQHDVFTLHIPAGDAAYFERLFRDVRIDATLFTLKEAHSCP